MKKGVLPPIILECPACGHRWESRAAGGQKIRCPTTQCRHRVKVPLARPLEQGAVDDAQDGERSRAEPVKPPLRRRAPSPSPLPIEDSDSNAATRHAREAMERLRSGTRQQQQRSRNSAHSRHAPSKMPAVHYADRLDDPFITREALNQLVWLIQELAGTLRPDLVPTELQHRAAEARLNLGGIETELARAQASGAEAFKASIAVSVPVITRAQKLLDEVRQFQPQQQLTPGRPGPAVRQQVTGETMKAPGDSAGLAAWLDEQSVRIAVRTDALSDDDPAPWYRPAVAIDRVAEQEVIRRQQEEQRAADAEQQPMPAPHESYAQHHPVLSEMTRITTRMMQRSR